MSMAAKTLLALTLSLLVYAAAGTRQCPLLKAGQCRLQRLMASQPNQRLQSEGGMTELWDENEDQFQCVGVAAMRNTLQPNSLSLPNFQPAPLMVYIEQGEGLMGITFPGCPETYESQTSQQGSQEEQRGRRRDHHQKVQRIRQGDIIAIPAGAAHWCYNDGNEELVAVVVMDLNNPANQLDQNFRSFFLAGGQPWEVQQSRSRQRFQNIFRGLDEQLLAEAYNVPVNIVRRMQEDDGRGIIVNCQDEMRRMIRPDEEEEEDQEGQRLLNGMEETICTARTRFNMDNRREVDMVSRQAGRITILNRHKLPILQYMELSAEKGHLFPNAMYTPNWSMTDHRVVYVTRGEGQVEIVDDNGRTVFDERVMRGDMFVIPQFYASMAKAGSNGFEWVTIKTSGQPMKNPMAGYTSFIRAMPVEVITNSYRMSSREAQNLKQNRGKQTFLLSPQGSSS